MKLTSNFSLHEFLEEDDIYPSETVIKNLTNLAHRLQVLRDILERPISINSGYRSAAYNATIKDSATNSQHILGKAADIVVHGMSAAKVQQYLRYWSGGMGVYNTFTHVDIRGYKARW